MGPTCLNSPIIIAPFESSETNKSWQEQTHPIWCHSGTTPVVKVILQVAVSYSKFEFL